MTGPIFRKVHKRLHHNRVGKKARLYGVKWLLMDFLQTKDPKSTGINLFTSLLKRKVKILQYLFFE